VQSAARAVYREVLERRAKETGVDFVNGIATALTPIGYLETVMVKGYETLVATDTKVDVQTAMVAAGKLQAYIDSHSGQQDMADIMVKMNRIIEAMRSTVPEELWPEIMRKLDGETGSSTDSIEVPEADDVEYGPAEFAGDDDDDF
jgi:hypothetical protein